MPNDAAAGYLDLVLLAAVSAKPGHGYEIIQEVRRRSRGEFVLGAGSIYPLLHRLEDEGLVTSRWTTASGRRRRIYKVSRKGKVVLGQREADFQRFVAAMAGMLQK